MMGWRAKLGVLVPSSNTTMEPELYRLAPQGVSLHFARLKILRDTPEEIEGMVGDLEKEAANLADAGLNAICFGCTAGSFYGGIDYDTRIIERIHDVTGTAATTTSTAVIRALSALKAKKISVLTPYPDWLNEKLRDYFERHGFEIVAMKGLDLETGMEEVPPERIYRMAREITKPESDTVFISCTDFPALEIVDRLEQDLGKPVVSSNLATMWMLLKIVSLPDKLGRYRICSI